MVTSPPPTSPYDMKYMAVAELISQVLCFSLGSTWIYAPPVKLRVALAPRVVVRLVDSP